MLWQLEYYEIGGVTRNQLYHMAVINLVRFYVYEKHVFTYFQKQMTGILHRHYMLRPGETSFDLRMG